jgi:O-antigen/teichoic acid export membrane protein
MTLRHSLFWSLTQQFGMIILQLVQMMLIARLLTPAEIGVFVLAFSVVIIVQGLREMGLGNYLIRDPDLSDDTIRSVFGLSIAMCIFMASGLALGRHAFAGWVGSPEVAQILAPIVVVVAIFPIEQSATALLRRDMRFDVLARISVTAKFISTITAIGLALWGMSTMALVWAVVVDAFARAIMLGFAEPRHLKLGPSWRRWRPLIGFGGWSTGASLSGQILVEGNKLLVGGMLGTGATALYDRAVRIPSMVRQGLFAPLGQVMLSSFAQDLREGRPIGGKVARLTAITTGMVWPIFAVIGVLSDEVVHLMLGAQWGETAAILPFLLLGQSMISLLPQPDQILVPFGYMRRLFIMRFLLMIQALGFAYIFLHWGLMAFAMSRPFSEIVAIVIIWIAIAPYMGVSTMTLLRGHLKSALVTLITVIPVAAWKFADLGAGSYLALAGLLIVSATFSLTGFMALKHPLADELRRAYAWLSQRRQLT